MAVDFSKALNSPSPVTQPIESSGTINFNSAVPTASNFNSATEGMQEVPGYGGVLVSAIAPALDFLSRPNYASAKFFDSFGNESKGIFESLGNAFSELVNPKDRLTFSDVIKKAAPNFAKDNPTSTKVLGFLADIALDPTTYLGIGFGAKGVKVGGKFLSEVGKEALTTGLARTSAEAFTNRSSIQLVELIGKEVARKNPNYVKIGQLGTALEKTGYNAAVLNKLDELADFASTLGAKTDNEVLKNLAIDEVGKDLKRSAIIDSQKLLKAEVRERVEERIVRLTETDIDLANKLFNKPQGLRLTASIPFSSFEKTIPYSEEVIRYVGLEPTKKLINSLRSVPIAGKVIEGTEDLGRQLKGLFVRPEFEPYKKAVTALENQFDYLSDSIIRTTRKMFDGVSPERREVIGRVMREVDDASRLFEEELARNLTPREATQIYTRILDERGAKLIPEDRAIIASLQQGYKDTMELEMQAGLLKAGKSNYSPRIYQILSDPDTMGAYRKQKLGLSTYLPSSQQRVFKTLNEAEVAGFVPEMDAAMLYAQRMLSSRRALAVNQFQDSIKAIYNIPDNVVWGSKEFVKFIPDKKIIDDIKLLGESVYPSGMNESMKYFLQGFDKLTSMFRRAATVVKPSFAPKQFVSNSAQVVLTQGIVPGLKLLDPRSYMDAALVLSDIYRNKATTSQLPPFLNKLFNSSPDAVLAQRVALSRVIGEERLQSFAKDFNLKTVFGEELPGEELVEELRRYGVIKGFDATGERFVKSLEEGLKFDPNNKKQLTKELLKYWKFPSIVEDYGRSVAYINARRMGYSAREASNQVNKALFDYQRGLTSFEKNFAKRALPFYQYPKNAIPLVLQSLATRPGNVASAQKIVNLMEKLIVDDTEQLSPAEREIFGDSFLIEQPRLFTGFDNTGKAKFNVFNNMLPLDALSLFVYDKDGDLNVGRTVEKTFLAALTPFIKVPLESAINKNFFTGRTVEEGGKLGDLSNGISTILPQVVKDSIGWEDRTNLRTGKTQTYINPYLAYYTFSAIPALKQFVSVGDASKTPLDQAMSFITGIVPSGVDLKEAQQFQQLGEQRELNNLKANIKLGMIRGSKNEYEKAQREYKDYIQLMMTKRQVEGEVRGSGIGANNQPELAQEQR